MSSAVTTPLPPTDADAAHVKRIWKAFWVLLVLTILELGLGLTIYNIDLGADPKSATGSGDREFGAGDSEGEHHGSSNAHRRRLWTQVDERLYRRSGGDFTESRRTGEAHVESHG